LFVAGCKTTGNDITGSIRASETPRSDADWRRSLELWGARYRENFNDPDAAMAYARALRATEQRAQAVAVLEQASIRNPHNMRLLGDYGRALAETGDYQQALGLSYALMKDLGRAEATKRHGANKLCVRQFNCRARGRQLLPDPPDLQRGLLRLYARHRLHHFRDADAVGPLVHEPAQSNASLSRFRPCLHLAFRSSGLPRSAAQWSI
jgi:tetratricopeptide (TPR) repeat protein